MRDMVGSRATLNVAIRYIICSKLQGGSDAETDTNVKKTRRARLAVGRPDRGAARPAGPAREPADHLGVARAAADLARLARGLRPSLPHRASNPPVGSARGRACRADTRQRLSPARARIHTIS